MEYTISSIDLRKKLAGILFFLMLTFIGELKAPKIILLFIILLFIIFDRNDKPKLSEFSKYFLLFIFLHGLIGLAVGAFNINENCINFITAPMLWPFIYMIALSLVKESKDYDNLIKVFIAGQIFILTYDILQIIGEWRGWHIPIIYKLDQGVSIYSTQLRLNFVNLRTVTMTTPLLFILLLSKYKFQIKNFYIVLIVILTFVLLILSGRRLQMVMMCVMFLFPLFLSNILDKKTSKRINRIMISLSVILILIILYYYSIYPDIFNSYIDAVKMGFSSSEEPTKFLQHKALMDKFFESPILGNGFGMTILERNKPGLIQHEFELTYQARLAWTGIIGFLFYYVPILLMYIKGYKYIKRHNDYILLSFLVALFFGLIADATNPYLSSFDTLWPIYLCLHRINQYEIVPKEYKYINLSK